MYENSFWSRFWGNLLHTNIPKGDIGGSGPQPSESNVFRPYCNQECLRGTFENDLLDQNCPNADQHGVVKHQISSQEIRDRMNEQLRANRYRGFQQLHITGRVCYLLKRILLSHGYTMLIKATSIKRLRRIHAELTNYENLMSLQGCQIPVCLGMLSPKIPYWYHGVS